MGGGRPALALLIAGCVCSQVALTTHCSTPDVRVVSCVDWIYRWLKDSRLLFGGPRYMVVVVVVM